MDTLTARHVRYIKLGREGRWFEECRRLARIALGHDAVPHALALAGDWAGLEAALTKSRGDAAREDVREVRDFYTLGADALWVTFDREHLWWTFAEPEVHLTEERAEPGSRYRRTIGGWRCTDLLGEPLRIVDLNAKLTTTRAYRRTICDVAARDYLLRRINGAPEPSVERAQAAQAEAVAAARELIAGLHPADFELLADLIFAAGGWRRLSVVGETMKDADLVLEQPATRERAFVQVKSTASQAVLADYVERFRAHAGSFQRMFFICHSPKGALEGALGSSDADVAVWTGDRLADQAVRAGLLDWLIERSA